MTLEDKKALHDAVESAWSGVHKLGCLLDSETQVALLNSYLGEDFVKQLQQAHQSFIAGLAVLEPKLSEDLNL